MSDRVKLPPAAQWLLGATLVTTIGNAMHTLTVGKLLFDKTGSAAAFGGLIIFEQVVAFLLQFIAGPWVDRGNPKRTCVQVELIRGFAICLASVMVARQQNVYLWVMLMTLVIRVAQPFYKAAMFAIGPSAIPAEALSRFNGYTNICLQAGQLLGVALAGLVLQLAGPPVAFMINGLTFVFSALSVAVIALPKAEIALGSAQSGSLWRQLLAGWSEIFALLRREAGLVWHLGLCALDVMAVNLFNLALVPIVAHRYAGSSYWLAVVDGAFAVGAIASAPAVELLERRLGQRGAAILGLGGQAVGFALLALDKPVWLTLINAFVIGAANTVSWTVLTTTLQIRSRGPVKGRIATVRSLVTAVLTAVLVPIVAKLEAVSLAAMLLTSGGICLLFVLVALVAGSPRLLGNALLGKTGETS